MQLYNEDKARAFEKHLVLMYKALIYVQVKSKFRQVVDEDLIVERLWLATQQSRVSGSHHLFIPVLLVAVNPSSRPRRYVRDRYRA